MPHMNGYSIYVHLNGAEHTVRLYRDVDDKHLHSWEGCIGLGITLRDAERRIAEDEASRSLPACGVRHSKGEVTNG